MIYRPPLRSFGSPAAGRRTRRECAGSGRRAGRAQLFGAPLRIQDLIWSIVAWLR